MKFKSWGNTVHADKCVWRESGKHKMYYLFILRIFFEVGRDVITKIGKLKYPPNCTTAL